MTADQNPLTLVMTIKSPEDLAALVAKLKRVTEDPENDPIRLALDKLQTVHFARFVFLENKTRLAVITTYDGDFETYINDFVDEIGDVFNAILVHMEDAPALPVQKNRDAFLKYVDTNNLKALPGFYSAYPTSSVLDIRAALRRAGTGAVAQPRAAGAVPQRPRPETR
jgi:hypothetical protein